MKYAIIENGTCKNSIIATPEYADQIGAVEMPEGQGIGSTYINGEWSSPEVPAPEPSLENYLLDLDYRLSLIELGVN